MGNAREFDRIAQEIFFPMYEVIVSDIIDCTKKTSGRMLDLGCGGGHLGLTMLKSAKDMTGILLDSNPEAAAIADQRAGEWGLRSRSFTVVGDVHQIPLPDGSIDLAISRGSIMFWKDTGKAFSEILRVLAPGGRTFIGSGMGNKELGEEITRKMKKMNPDWPDCVHRSSNGHTMEDYRAILTKLGAQFEFINNKNQGKWIIFCKKSS